MNSYIYIRQNKYWKLDNVCKIGSTTNIPDRNSQYITCEPIKGKFTHVFEFYENDIALRIEKGIQKEFNKFHFNENGGTEFFDIKIIDFIDQYIKDQNYEFKKLTDMEINNLSRKKRNKKNKSEYENRFYQTEIINNSVKYFESNDKGLLVLMCGVGKTVISLLTAKKMNMKNILIGVPNIILLEQWSYTAKKIFNYEILKVYGNTNNEEIIEFFESNNNKIMITTYASSYKISNKHNTVFDIAIFDEVHHITTKNISNSMDKKSFIQILNVKSRKQIGLTATLKHILDNNSISNKDTEYFGKIIEQRSLLWAIENNIICDYEIQTLIYNNIDDLNELIDGNDNNKRLLFSAYCALMNIKYGYSHHLLIYTNKIENSQKVNKYLDILNNKYQIDDIYYSNFVSEMPNTEQTSIINKFEKSKYGIISCVYCLGEGWDFPLLDGVIFAENMSSKIRIVQSALRPCRKNRDYPNKINKIILPIINKDFTDSKNKDLQKIREVIYQISIEDESIVQKIKTFNISGSSQGGTKQNHYLKYDKDLTQHLRLFTQKRLSIGITYEKAKEIIRKHNNILTKDDYYQLCERDFRLTKEPEILYDKYFNWIDYLGINKKNHYDINECIKMCESYIKGIVVDDILDLSKICNKLCKIDKKFPPNGLWTYFYDISDIGKIIKIRKKNNNSDYSFLENL